MDPLLRSLIAASQTYAPWSKPEVDGDGDYWTHNPYMRVSPDRHSYFYEPDVNATCSKLFGAYSGGERYGGCVSYGTDQDGLMANIISAEGRTQQWQLSIACERPSRGGAAS